MDWMWNLGMSFGKENKQTQGWKIGEKRIVVTGNQRGQFQSLARARPRQIQCVLRSALWLYMAAVPSHAGEV